MGLIVILEIMNTKIFGLPLSMFVLAFILTLFVSIPLYFVYTHLSAKIEEEALQTYQLCSVKPFLPVPEASKSATPSGKVK